MKVLEHGKIMTCPSCMCKMIYDANDIKHMEGDGIHNSYDYIVCPDCGKMISLHY